MEKTVKCPKCKTEMAKGVRICPSCGCRTVARRNAWIRFVVALVLVAMGSNFGVWGLLLSLSLVCVLYGCAMLLKSRRLAGGLLAGAGAFIAVVLVTCLFDAPPIPDDYTVADLRTVPENCRASYKILLSLAEPNWSEWDMPSLGLTADDVDVLDAFMESYLDGNNAAVMTAVQEHAQGIRAAWLNARKARDAIDALDNFEQIADETDPAFDLANARTGDGLPRPLRITSYLYVAHVYVESIEGDRAIAANDLILFDSVMRKYLYSSRTMLRRGTCAGALFRNMRVATFLAESPGTSPAIHRLLADHFQPLRPEQDSYANTRMCWYLLFKNMMEHHPRTIGSRAILKPNSSCRLVRRMLFPSRSQDLEVWPSIWLLKTNVAINVSGKVPLIYRIYNPLGSVMASLHSMESTGEQDAMGRKLIAESEKLANLLREKSAGAAVPPADSH